MSLVLLLAGGIGACNADNTLTAEERAELKTMALKPLAPSPSNAFADNPAAAELGQQFFFDRRFSGPLVEGSDPANGGLGAAGTPGMVACVTCHDPASGGTDHRSQGPTSLAAAWTGRNTPTVLNAAYSPWMFWDGRKDSLWSQALGPVESSKEHNTTRMQIVHLIYDKYRAPYEAIFGAMPPLSDTARFPADGRPGMTAFEGMSGEDRMAVNRVFANFGKSIEAYERKLVDKSSAFDRFLGGDESAMTPEAIRGAKLFIGKAGCTECHSGPMLADGGFHNHGVPQRGAKIPSIDEGRYHGIPDVLGDEFNANGPYSDGKMDRLDTLKQQPTDLGSFKTPTLRNVSKTGPYMHTGAFSTLWDVMAWYNEAAGADGFSGTREAASLVPLGMSKEDLNDLVEFMKALEGEGIDPALVHAPQLP